MEYRFILAFLSSVLSLYCSMAQSNDFIQDFIKANPDKVAFYFMKDDSISFGLNEKKSMPVASLAKTIVALEFAFQEDNGDLDADEMVALSEIDRFAIGDENYKNWKKQIRKDKLIKNRKIPLKYIAQGMIRFSANACADFLLNKLGIDRVNGRIKALSLEHEPIFPFTASLLLAFNYQDKDKSKFLSSARKWTREEYRNRVLEVHQKITEDKDFLKNFRSRFKNSRYRDRDYDKFWTDRFSYSSTKEYALLITKINSDFEPKLKETLWFVFESWTLGEQSKLKRQFKRVAYKGANSNSMINVWLYLKSNDNSRTQFVAFFNQLNKEEYKNVEKEISNFGFALSTKEDYMNAWKELCEQISISQ